MNACDEMMRGQWGRADHSWSRHCEQFISSFYFVTLTVELVITNEDTYSESSNQSSVVMNDQAGGVNLRKSSRFVPCFDRRDDGRKELSRLLAMFAKSNAPKLIGR